MGVITIEFEGSFPRPKKSVQDGEGGNFKTFTAQCGGHAAAIGRAIEYLSAQLPDAIALDHDLQAQGKEPGEAPFGRVG